MTNEEDANLFEQRSQEDELYRAAAYSAAFLGYVETAVALYDVSIHLKPHPNPELAVELPADLRMVTQNHSITFREIISREPLSRASAHIDDYDVADMAQLIVDNSVKGEVVGTKESIEDKLVQVV